MVKGGKHARLSLAFALLVALGAFFALYPRAQTPAKSPSVAARNVVAPHAMHGPATGGSGAPAVVARAPAKGPPTFRGMVFDATGGIVPGARVRVVHALAGGITEGDTDERGAFGLPVPVGDVTVSASASGYSDASVIARAPAEGVRLVLVPGASIEGRVVTRANEPVAGAAVRAVAARTRPTGTEPVAITDETGAFTVSRLAPGAYELFAEGPHVRGRRAEPIELDLADVVGDITVVVDAAARVGGRVVVLPSNEPCRRGSVSLTQAFGGGRMIPIATRAIADDGAVAFDGIPRGSYGVSVDCDEHVPDGAIPPLEVGAADATDVVWKVVGGASLAVSVVDSSKAGVANVRGFVRGPTELGVNVRVLPFLTDERGSFLTPSNLQPGTYTAELTEGRRAQPATIAVASAQRQEVALHLEGSGTIAVDVRSDAGEPVDTVAVVAIRTGADQREARGISLGRGHYELAGLPNGTYAVVVRDGLNADVALKGPEGPSIRLEGGTVRLTAVLARRGTIKGRVVEANGAEAPNVWIHTDAERAADADGLSAPAQPVLTDVDGRFAVTGLAPDGRFTLRAEFRLGATAIRRGVRPGEDVLLTLSSAVRVEGRVSRADGRPVRAASVHAIHVETGATRSARVSADGHFELSGVPVGLVHVSAVDESGAEGTAEIRLDGRGSPARLDVVLNPS